MALLVGLITPEDASILKAIKNLRNLFAHRVRIDFLSPAVLKVTTELLAIWIRLNESRLIAAWSPAGTDHLKDLAKHLPKSADAGQGLLLAIFTVYQAYFHRLHSKVSRLPDAVQ